MPMPDRDHISDANPYGPKPRLALLVAHGPLANIVINRLTAQFPGTVVIRERPETKMEILRRRARLVGPGRAASQAAAGMLVRLMARRKATRMSEICQHNALDATPPASGPHIIDVASVNDVACHHALADIDPDVVAVYGTRILKPETLAACQALYLNYHAGITPHYRGQHPGYWALANAEPDKVGVTVHCVDRGVDTGAIVQQAVVALSPAKDTIATYQYVQMAHGLRLFCDAITRALAGRLIKQPAQASTSDSPHYYPPTLFQYLKNGLTRGVW